MSLFIDLDSDDDIRTSTYIITHVFCPLQLPDAHDHSIQGDHSLARSIANAARLYSDHVDEANLPQWLSISRMLDNIQAITQFRSMDESRAISQFNSMEVGDVLALLIRAQNAGVVFRKQKDVTIFESFELSPKAKDVMAAEGKLICSYPGPAIEIPNLVFDDEDFLSELVNFLVHMNQDVVETVTSAKNRHGRSLDFEDTVHPHYITELLTGILRSVGRPAEIPRISKRVGDDVVCNTDSALPWRRSALWLLIRVALQTTLDQSPLGHDTYKRFMLFFMCCLVEEETCAELPSDLLHFVSAKISRRLCKLGSSAPDWLSCTVSQTCSYLRSTIETRWKQVQATQRQSPLWDPSQLDLSRDIQLSLSGSQEYLHKSLANPTAPPPNTPFVPIYHPRGTLDDFLSSGGNYFQEGSRLALLATLYDVERAVEEGIDSWVSRVTDNEGASVKLEILAHEYSSRALDMYANNPRLLSVMLLTTVELWIALDKIVIKEIPILIDYSPEVPASFLENLLFCKADSLHRLRRAHEYLSHRHSQSRIGWSVFSPIITTESFSIRMYRKSSHLRSLKGRIEEAARHDIREKVIELQRMNARHAELRGKVKWPKTKTPDDMDMQINVHEWPLPINRLQAEVVVFELDCPVSFNMWRAATFHLLVDVCSPSTRKGDKPRTKLNLYHPLTPFFVNHPRSRISLGSRSWSALDRKLSIPAKQGEVCIKNELEFTPFDTHSGIFVSQTLGRSDVSQLCSYQLGSGPYRKLQHYVSSTFHTSNKVIAEQAICHKDLSIHEYMAFGHLRSGGLLQWHNVLRELRGRSLNFHRPEVHMLLAQAVSQVGPLSKTGWIWHQEIEEPTFCSTLLCELEGLVKDVEANWKEGPTMDTISFLLRRLLASRPDEAISRQALSLLRTVRGKVFSWVKELSAELVRTPGEGEFRGVLRDTAAICRSTFDVDPPMIPNLLHSAEDIEILLSCAIIIRDHVPDNISRLPPYSQLLLGRDQRLSLTVENTLSHIIRADASDQGINLAISRVFPDYYPGTKWSPLPGLKSSWFSCTTAPPSNQRPQMLHLNLLDGSLLVDGKPLGTWLPNEIAQHPLYKLIFGERMLQVIPANLPGMDYCTRDLIFDHLIYFSLRNGKPVNPNFVMQEKPKRKLSGDSWSSGSIETTPSENLESEKPDIPDLVIQAKRKRKVPDDLGIIELIPREKLEGDLPAVLIEGHIHWLNLSTSIMEIRPFDRLWEDSLENWTVDYTHHRMRKGHECLVDIRSQTWRMVSSLLEPLCAPRDLIVSVSPEDPSQPVSLPQLSVFLPRYDLSFFVDQDGDLQSRNMRGMVYDENQFIGTLFGLVNRLVLRPKAKGINTPELIPRCVLIPDGEVSFRMDSYHVRVEIIPGRSALERAMCYTYQINTDLGYLMGNASLTSKLYCTYLHALTSGSSADPLTGRFGTEEALSVLQSASCCSNARFGPRDAELLILIASIYPLRKWCQHSKQSVYNIDWRDLPATSQHYGLYVLSKKIKDRYERVQIFFESQMSFPFEKEFPLLDDHLVKRDARRAAYLFPSESFWQPSGAKFDVRYPGRDILDVGSGEHFAYTAATCVYLKKGTSAMDMWTMAESWEKELPADIALSLRYDKSWLAPDLASIWLKAYNLLRNGDDSKWFQMLFTLPVMAYSSPNHRDLVPVFVAFASHSQFRVEDPPNYDSFPMLEGCHPSMAILRGYVIGCAYPLQRSPENSTQKKPGESNYKSRRRQLREFNKRVRSDADAAVESLLRAWPCLTFPLLDSLNPKLYNLAYLESKVQCYFAKCHCNLELKEHLIRVQTILENLPIIVTSRRIPPHTFHPSQSVPSYIPWRLTADQLFTRPAPPLQAHERLPRYIADVHNIPLPNSAPLNQLIDTVKANTANGFQHEYLSALRTSGQSLGSEITPAYHRATNLPSAETLVEHYNGCKASHSEAFSLIRRHLSPACQTEEAVEQASQWPRFTSQTLLRFLASNSPVTLPDDWKSCLITFTLIALELQRARRLALLCSDDLHEELWRELQNEGCDGWNADSHPDWLLIQLQGNFLIRRVQAEVAREMILPRSGDNTAMQLNMGEGKSSVIVPIVAAALADSKQLVRIIVPKPLTTQTLHLLTDRLGGLTNRRVYYVPYSRSLEASRQNVFFLRMIMLECMRERGVLVVQPDHVLSLKLVSVEKQLCRAEEHPVAYLLLDLQRWLHSHSRDILDESDEVLDVRSQLLFTIGEQHEVEGSPERWTTTEQVLTLVSKRAPFLSASFPLGIEYDPGPSGSFPYLRILHAKVGRQLISWIVQDVMEGHLPNINFRHHHFYAGLKDAIQNFISHDGVSSADVQLVKKHFGQTSLWTSLLLLRGLLANDILLLAFRERRFRVDYGLAPTRTMLAVPYRAKDVPSQRAEFGHPDVAIVLTYLAYYYAGLSEQQLKTSFGILLEQHDPSINYDLWIRACPAVPEFLRTLSGVNMESVEQWNKFLFPLFSRNRETVNFYLSTIVFPREAKEFCSKLSSSGWDLAEKKERLLTGFSGTNDGQHLLPMHIAQCDPDHQRGTNAKVLCYLLQPENKHYICMTHENGKRKTTREFLQILVEQEPEIRVLLDVGAQMLDLQNHELAQAWLDIASTASAAIYFNQEDELTVLTRDGNTQLLLSSPYAQQLDRCIVYLDDAHTRGTDIKFPNRFRAAVTLGPKVTKDRLVQGCMRMRKLGHGHSIIFFAPLEVDQRIRYVAGKSCSDDIHTIDILHWAIRETWENIQRWAPHWAQQGMDHGSRYSTWIGFSKAQLTSEELSEKWLQRETKKMEDLYHPHDPSNFPFQTSPDIHRRCVDLGVRSLWSVGTDEEQERELVYEVRREQQVEQRPPKVPPATHSVHPDIVNFVKTGIICTWTRHSGLVTFSPAFKPAFKTLDGTSAASDEAFIWGQSILVTTDFAHTVELEASGKRDDYLRPVHWIVSAKRSSGDVFVIISPHEANTLLPVIRASNKVHLHLYTPRITKSMKLHSDLALYSIPTVPNGWIPPSTLMDQLNVFSGQLYLKDYETYIRLCQFLWVYAKDLESETNILVEPDGFILPKNRNRIKHSRVDIGHTFASTPLVAIKALMSLRSQGVDFSSTHMGKIIRGIVLSEDDFDDQQNNNRTTCLQ